MTTFDATIGPEVSQAAVSFNASGDNTVVAGSLGKQIKVLQLFLSIGGASNITFKSGASTTLSGSLVNLATFFMDYFQLPLTCNTGDSFVINSSSAVQVSGTIWYAQL